MSLKQIYWSNKQKSWKDYLTTKWVCFSKSVFIRYVEDTIAGIAVYHLCMGCIGVCDAQKIQFKF